MWECETLLNEKIKHFIFRNIDLVTPYPVKRSADEKHYTYLDTIGRPVVTASKNKLVEQHIIDFEVRTSIFHHIYANSNSSQF